MAFEGEAARRAKVGGVVVFAWVELEAVGVLVFAGVVPKRSGVSPPPRLVGQRFEAEDAAWDEVELELVDVPAPRRRCGVLGREGELIRPPSLTSLFALSGQDADLGQVGAARRTAEHLRRDRAWV